MAKGKILVTGGAGYVGSVLVPKLIANGYEVKILDLYIYGKESLKSCRQNPLLQEIKGDIRDIRAVKEAVKGIDAVIHLACISNDPSAELDTQLTKSINQDAFVPLLKASKSAGVERFIFASSSSVYGISDDPNVRETHKRVPVSEYNKTKAYCEDQLSSYYSDEFCIVTVRPATVCGYSPRLRLDLTVNILTNHAFHKNEITVFGGDQYRPNLHIEDMSDLYVQLLREPSQKISGQTFNAGYQNQKVIEIAESVKWIVDKRYPEREPVRIKQTPSNDVRSYRISTEKIERELGYKPRKNIGDAVLDLCKVFERGSLRNTFSDSKFHNVARMKEINLQ